MSGIDAPNPWDATIACTCSQRTDDSPCDPGCPSSASAQRYAPPVVPPPNGTRHDCPICGCKPGTPHLRERRTSIHAHAYGGDPEDTALD